MKMKMHTALILGWWNLLTVTCQPLHSTASTAPVTGASVLGTLTIEAPDVSLVGETEVFNCVLDHSPVGETVLYELLQRNSTDTYGEYSAHGGEVASFNLLIMSPSYEGSYFCRASVQNQTAVPAAVSDGHYFQVIEPVEGAELVSVPPLAEVFEGSGLTLSCSVKKGTHVSYDWSFNGGPFMTFRHAASAHRLSMARASLEDAGNYSCRAWNRLNNTHVYIVITHMLVKVKVPVSKPRMSFMALAVVLSCFFFLLCLMTVCCVYGVIYRKRLSPLKPRPTFITDMDSMESEDEIPVEKEYLEDVEFVTAPNIEDTDRGEEDSLDEWPDLERALTISCMDEEAPNC